VEPDLIVVGDLMVDVAVDSAALRRGGDVHGEVRLRPGGSAANAAVWAAHAGAGVRLHGRVGDDLAGRLIGEALEDRGVGAGLVVDRGSPTGTMLVVREAGERSMVADRGANARLSPQDLPPRLVAGAVLVSGYITLHHRSEPASRAAMDRAEARWVAVDAASWPLLEDLGPDGFLKASSGANLLLANEREARTLSGIDDPQRAAKDLAAHYGAAAVKLGAEGAVLCGDFGVIRAPSPAIDAVDPTGAGDAFDGVLLASLAGGANPDDALRAACRAGSRAAASADPWPEPR
jgi:sugar/nucleoside kinase (ribokinase family)